MLQGRDPVTGEGLSDENIRYQLVTFLIAGHETTSGLLSFATYFLCKNPQVLAKARAEVDAVLGDEMPRVEHLAQAALHRADPDGDAAHLADRAGLRAARRCRDTVIGGKYAVTRRDTLMVLSPMLHRDPKVWGDDVEEFRPERFAPEAMEKLPPNAWKPFGNGQRACIGRPFAMQEAQLLMSMILQRFDLIEDDPSYQLKVAETLTLKPRRLPHPRQAARHARRSSCAARCRRSPPSRPAPRRSPRRAQPASRRRPLLVLYGSNTGSAEAFAERIASDAAGAGLRGAWPRRSTSTSAHLPTDGAVVILTASYEGQPPDNARQFTAWLEALPAGRAEGRALRRVRLRQPAMGAHLPGGARSASTPRSRPPARRASRQRGETDAGGDFFGAFDEWYGALWADLGRALGKEVQAAPTGGQLQVEVVKAGRTAILRAGRPAARRGGREPRAGRHGVAARPLEAPHRHRAARGHELPRRRLPRGAAAQPDRRRDARAEALQPRLRQPDRHPQAREQHHVAAGRLSGQRERSCCSTTSSWPAGDARPGRRRWRRRRAARPRRPS